MLHPKIGGAYYEMGLRYGAALRAKGFRFPSPPKEKMDFAKDCEEEVVRVFPEILDEMRGIADACLASYEDVAAFVLGIGAFVLDPIICSAFAVANGDEVIVGRNYDTYYKFSRCSEAYLTCPRGGHWSIGHSDVFVGREGGVNEKGLAIAVCAVEEVAVRPGMSLVLAARYVLDRCQDTEEAVTALSEMRHSTANNFLLADREGNLAVVEAAPDRVRIRRPDEGNGFILCTNHFLHPDMLEMENREKRCWDSEVRYEAIHNFLKGREGQIDATTAQTILSDHSGHVCFHDKQNDLGTLWSFVATLRQLRILRAEGHPCRNRYKEDLRLNRAIELRSRVSSS